LGGEKFGVGHCYFHAGKQNEEVARNESGGKTGKQWKEKKGFIAEGRNYVIA